MWIAEDLIRIAFLVAKRQPKRSGLGFEPLQSRGSPGRGRAAELELEGPRKGFTGLEAGSQCGFQYGFRAAARQPKSRFLQPSPLRIAAQGFAHPGSEDAMKVEPREIGYVGQLRAIQRLIEVRVDVVQHTVYAAVYSAREAWAEGLVGMVGVLKVSVHLADNLLIVMPLGMS